MESSTYKPLNHLCSMLCIFFLCLSSLSPLLDLSCVSHMPYLAILDASHNEISDFFGFQPPKNLKVKQDLELTG